MGCTGKACLKNIDVLREGIPDMKVVLIYFDDIALLDAGEHGEFLLTVEGKNEVEFIFDGETYTAKNYDFFIDEKEPLDKDWFKWHKEGRLKLIRPNKFVVKHRDTKTKEWTTVIKDFPFAMKENKQHYITHYDDAMDVFKETILRMIEDPNNKGRT